MYDVDVLYHIEWPLGMFVLSRGHHKVLFNSMVAIIWMSLHGRDLPTCWRKYSIFLSCSSPRFWKVTTNIQGDQIIRPMGIYASTFILFLVQDSPLMSFHKVVFLVCFKHQHYWPYDWRYTIWASYALDFLFWFCHSTLE
jgi:hypothetical protein